MEMIFGGIIINSFETAAPAEHQLRVIRCLNDLFVN